MPLLRFDQKTSDWVRPEDAVVLLSEVAVVENLAVAH